MRRYLTTLLLGFGLIVSAAPAMAFDTVLKCYLVNNSETKNMIMKLELDDDVFGEVAFVSAGPGELADIMFSAPSFYLEKKEYKLFFYVFHEGDPITQALVSLTAVNYDDFEIPYWVELSYNVIKGNVTVDASIDKGYPIFGTFTVEME